MVSWLGAEDQEMVAFVKRFSRYGASALRCDRIYVGHTIFKDIKRFYKGKVIAVNVDNLDNYNHQRGRAVLIDDDKVYVVGDKGIKRKL